MLYQILSFLEKWMFMRMKIKLFDIFLKFQKFKVVILSEIVYNVEEFRILSTTEDHLP